jgi:sarcosine oxidase
MNGYDVIVLGVGGMGSAAAYHLARRGLRVLGLEQFDIPHDRGSSHGQTRIIRLAYWEHPSYVPLARRAFELWREIEHLGGERLLYVTGSLDIGRPESDVVAGSIRSCLEHHLPHQILTAAELSGRFPAYQFPGEYQAVLQPDGGFLLAERCIVAHVTAAQATGAEIRARERVVTWETTADGVRVQTDRETYQAGHLVVCAGAWAGQLLPGLARVAVPERQMMMWLQPKRPELFQPGRFPVFVADVDEDVYYGLPAFGVPGFKFGRHRHLRQVANPDDLDRSFSAEEEAVLRAVVERYLPDGNGPTMAARACMYTNSPDSHFIIGRHPSLPRVTVAAGFSGHGFKFCSVVGEILADLAQLGETRHDIALFRLERLAV